MRRYRKILLLTVVVALSLISASVSFFIENAYVMGHPHRGTPADETWESAITTHGFPFFWHSEIRSLRGGYLEYERFEFHPSAFFFDVFIYIISYSAITIVVLRAREFFNGEERNKTKYRKEPEDELT